jgi:hypothetical protein
MGKTWKPTAAGVMTIISGCYGIGVGATVVQGASFLDQLLGDIWIGGMQVPMDMGGIAAAVAAFGIVFIVLGVIALIGGIFALRRRVWGFALAGAILSLPLIPAGTVLGIISIVFLAKSKEEFD